MTIGPWSSATIDPSAHTYLNVNLPSEMDGFLFHTGDVTIEENVGWIWRSESGYATEDESQHDLGITTYYPATVTLVN
ncbi:MAG: hypothetical protein KGY80_05440 [Candidatus Thorarchaeota archaeon]|nr:hypothetical protein [Candidatus Thorarchaeota archaeon]